MSFTETRFVNPRQLTTSASTALYTVPTGKSAIIKQLVVTNTTSTSATFAFYINGTSADRALFSNTSVLGNDSLVINLSQVLNSGDTINALASANTTLNITVSGVLNDGPLNPASMYLADNAVTTPKIADGSITTAKIATGAVVTEDIADAAITTAKIANNAVVHADLSTDIPLSGFRNFIINGGFDIWQRATSATTTGTDAYSSADRWRIRTAAAAGSVASSRQPAGLTGFQYCMRFQRVSGNTNTSPLQLIQTLETSESIKLTGGPITVSFWARSGPNYSPTSSLLSVNLVSGTGTDQYWLSFTSPSFVVSQTATLTSSWQRFTFTATPPSNATQFYLQFEMSPTGTAGANDYFDITGVQLERSPQVTPFEQRPVGTELQMCMRYYERSAPSGYYVISGMYGSSAYINVFYKVRKRISPSVSGLSGGAFDGTNEDNFGVGQSGNAWVLTSWIASAEL